MSDATSNPTVSENTLAGAMRRPDVFADKCPSREILSHVTSRWGVLLLVALGEGTHRFSDLRRKVKGISEKMLAQTLQVLEGDGFVERIAYPVVPPHVEYRLTPLGEQIGRHVEALADWIEGKLPEILAARVDRVYYVKRKNGGN
jgi:DNA-binding HxlR family transcriptional regulator